ncbi:PREDICTED: probable receptor-like protein kinase At5g47070 [Ipomoea nil]|uniref:probable receptor-like protein kinase At5g47070 n=1 Tax=Ipomoea nil TaxID=35883 RepID=UPI00090147CD|nr:PREDICTED: probable receptor-like protein kinase At5g47070 [Ipomoea nil]
MRLSGNCSAAVGGSVESTSGDCGGDAVCGGGRGRVVAVVGVKLDTPSKELLTWALVKIAQPGDVVIALHVLNPNSDKSEMLSLVKTFDSMVTAYEGFCNLKQVDLRFKVCRGSPARKVLASEANIYNAPNLIVGTSSTHHTIRSSVSVAKYCARKVEKSISVMAVNNGKIVFHKESTGQGSHIYDVLELRVNNKTLTKSPLSLSPKAGSVEDSCMQLPLSSSGNVGTSLALVPVKTMDVPESNSGSALLRRVLLQNIKSGKRSAKTLSMLQAVQELQNQESFKPIDLDQKQNISDKEECQSSNLDVVAAPTESTSFQIPKELECLSKKYSSTCRLFGYRELLTATSSFIPENLIGKGGSSKVYKGCLPDGKELAVKIFKPSEVVMKQFLSEIETITTLHHKHIISLLGFCIEDNNILLVYDLLSRGSLEDNLHGAQNIRSSFGWHDRYKVALGVAQALDHLHNLTTGSIIHRDVKSSNILLSDDFEPKLSDFGLATLASFSSRDLDGTDIAGTFGYLAPEYFMHGKINEKIDVYAYGVVLLELLSGRKPIDNTNAKGQESLVMWAKQILENGKPTDLLDLSLIDTYDHDEFERMVLAATLCIKRASKLRPPINIVVKLLQGEEEAINLARQRGNGSEGEVDVESEQQDAPPNIQSFLNVALQNLDSDSLSSSSSDQHISVEDYLRGRYSRSSSFD